MKRHTTKLTKTERTVLGAAVAELLKKFPISYVVLDYGINPVGARRDPVRKGKWMVMSYESSDDLLDALCEADFFAKLGLK